MKYGRHLNHDLIASIRSGSIQQEVMTPDPNLFIARVTTDATGRPRGRPAGAKTQGPDARRGRSSGKHPGPEPIELLRMTCLDIVSSYWPGLLEIEDLPLDRLENELDKEFARVLREAK